MPNYSKNDVVLLNYPYSNFTGAKVRPVVVISVPNASQDLFVVPLTTKTSRLMSGEFILADWTGAGLNIVSAVKRGVFTAHSSLVLKSIGVLSNADAAELSRSLRLWMGL